MDVALLHTFELSKNSKCQFKLTEAAAVFDSKVKSMQDESEDESEDLIREPIFFKKRVRRSRNRDYCWTGAWY